MHQDVQVAEDFINLVEWLIEHNLKLSDLTP